MAGLLLSIWLKNIITIIPKKPMVTAPAKMGGIIDLVVENTDYTKAQVLHLVKMGVGHVDWVSFNGQLVPVPKSISYHDMPDNAEFKKFFDDAVDFICRKIIPGLNRSDLEREVYELLGIPA